MSQNGKGPERRREQDKGSFGKGFTAITFRCSCGNVGYRRVDNGLYAGIHCDACWKALKRDSRKQSW